VKERVSPQECLQYQKDGFIVIEDFLSSDELERWCATVEDAIAARGQMSLPGRWQQDPNSDYERVFAQRINLWMDHEGMRDLMLDERLGRMATQLAGVSGIRVWHDQALIKPAWGAPTDWHMDNPYWSFASPDAISLWVALDDVTPDNGCLYFIPGSHKVEPKSNPSIGSNMSALFKLYPEFAGITAVRAEMKAGSASFHNGRTFHAAQANMTPRPRRAMTCAYMPDGSVFNGQQNVLPDDYFKSLSMGDVLNDDRFVPLIYAQSRQTTVP